LVARAEGVEVVEVFKWWPGLRGLRWWMCLVDRQAPKIGVVTADGTPWCALL
jgi:hypothetical protein